MALPGTSINRQPMQPGPLDRIAMLAARLLDAPWAAIVTGEGVRASTAWSLERDFQAAAQALEPRLESQPLAPASDLKRAGGRCRFCAAARIDGWEGKRLGTLLVAWREGRGLPGKELRQLTELAALAAGELELELRRASPHHPERRRTQEQLLDKTLELTKFSEDLRQIHRLSTSSYDTLDGMFGDYLETGCGIFGLSGGVITRVRGRYGTVTAARGEGAPRTGATFELDRLFCGLVAGEGKTLASASIDSDARLTRRAHHGAGAYRSYIGAPILVEDGLWGVLSFSAPYRRWRRFTSHEIELAELMAKSIGRSLLEGRMLEARKKAETLEADRSRVLEMVAKNQPLDAVLEEVARLVERQAPALAAAVHLTDGGRLDCRARGSMPAAYAESMAGASLESADGCCLRAALTGQLEMGGGARCEGEGPAHEHCWQAAAAAPVIGGSGEVLGLVTVYWRMAVEPRHVDTDLLEMAAQLAAIATEHRRLTDRLEFQARHDALTGLPNRTLFTEVLGQAVERCRGGECQVAVVFVDLDRFKQINDHWGHAAGDSVLRETARRIEACLEPGEAVARLGGDEFVAMLAPVSGREEAVARSEQILEAVRAPIRLHDQSVVVTASIGLSLYPQSLRAGNAISSAEQLLAGADQAMYQVKNSGKNGVLVSNAEAHGARAKDLQLEHSLRRALERGEFRLYFQPVLDIREGAGIPLEELEVLLGWDHPQLGRIGPAQFIPIAEQCGMIAPIGAWVLREACRQSAVWRSRGLPPVRLAVNVSPLQFETAGFVELVEQALAESGLPPSALELELTESAIVSDIDSALPKLERLRSLGVRITLDDFGTGYSSLSYLRWMPVDALKIDRSFVADMMGSANTRTLVQAILALAHSMELTVVAEGIETEEQFEALTGMGCDHAQGHLFGQPLPVEEMEQWLAQESR